MGLPIFNTRPTFQIDGRAQPALAQDLLSLACVENVSGAGECEATFNNWGVTGSSADFLYFDRRVLNHGKSLQIKADTHTLFDGVIVGLEAQFPNGRAPTIKVLAAARPSALRTTRRTRTFTNLTDAALFTRIATEHGLTPDIQLSGPPHVALEQSDQSDLAFLYDRARRSDAEVWLDGGTLHARSRTDPNRAVRPLRYGASLIELVMSDELAASRAMLSMQARAVLDQLAAVTGGITRFINAGFRVGSPVADTPPSDHGVAGHGLASDVHVLQVGTFASLQGIGPLFRGDYFTTEVRVLFDTTMGLRAEFSVERAGQG